MRRRGKREEGERGGGGGGLFMLSLPLIDLTSVLLQDLWAGVIWSVVKFLPG